MAARATRAPVRSSSSTIRPAAPGSWITATRSRWKIEDSRATTSAVGASATVPGAPPINLTQYPAPWSDFTTACRAATARSSKSPTTVTPIVCTPGGIALRSAESS
jgi:hypothetical protein